MTGRRTMRRVIRVGGAVLAAVAVTALYLLVFTGGAIL